MADLGALLLLLIVWLTFFRMLGPQSALRITRGDSTRFVASGFAFVVPGLDRVERFSLIGHTISYDSPLPKPTRDGVFIGGKVRLDVVPGRTEGQLAAYARYALDHPLGLIEDRLKSSLGEAFVYVLRHGQSDEHLGDPLWFGKKVGDRVREMLEGLGLVVERVTVDIHKDDPRTAALEDKRFTKAELERDMEFADRLAPPEPKREPSPYGLPDRTYKMTLKEQRQHLVDVIAVLKAQKALEPEAEATQKESFEALATMPAESVEAMVERLRAESEAALNAIR